MKIELLLASALIGVSAFAGELYVDRSGADGAYTSINAAIGAAADGDTIWVKPGVYDNEPAANAEAPEAYPDVPAVVYVTKPVKIIATDPDPSKTAIVGRFDPETKDVSGKKGAGPNAIRCVRFSSGAKAALLKGFTIRDGACYASNDPVDEDWGQPGGVAGRTNVGMTFWVTDCVISNCVGYRGGLIRKGNYVRCRFSDGIGLAGQAVGRDMALMSCLVTRSTGIGVVMDGTAIVNTTFVDMDAVPFNNGNGSIPFYNCVITSCREDRTAEPKKGTAFCSLLPYPELILDQTECVNQVDDGIPFPLIAPLRGDFRLRTGTKACGIGLAKWIAEKVPAVPEDLADLISLYKDMDGKAIPSEGAINPGCYQETVEPKTGVLQVSSTAASKRVNCDGHCGQVPLLYASGTEPSELFKVAELPGERPAFMCKIGDYYRYPDMDGFFRIQPPPVGRNVTNALTVSTCEYWVDPTNGVDGAVADGYGTAEKPFKTLQHPCSLAVANGYTFIHAAAGVYDEGGDTYSTDPADMTNYHTNRVCIMSHRNAYVKGAGRGRSFIVGKKDTTSPGASKGMGSAAVRCVLNDYDTYGCVQGFTLRESYADYSSSNDDNRRFSGGFFCSMQLNNRQHVLADCEIAGDGQAFRGAIAYGGSLVRCVVHGYRAEGQYGGAIRLASVENCVFYDNDWGASNSPNVDSSFFGCTLTSDLASPVNSGNADLRMENCLVQAGGSSKCAATAALSKVRNTVMWWYEAVSGSDSLYLADPKFASTADRDYRLKTSSPALSLGFKPLSDDWMQVQTDVNGKPRLRLNGCIVPGAVQDAVEIVTAVAPRAGSVDKEGDTVVEPGESVTVNFTKDESTHKMLGVLVDDELEEGATSYTYTAKPSPFAADGTPVAPVTVAALYQTNWYVNANVDPAKGVIGDDSNDGQAPETPWRTLAKLQAMKDVLWAGDVVHAAPGDYNALTVETTVKRSFIAGYDQLPSRVEVPADVTLIADEGPEVTFITGESGSGTYGMGPGAVRCASICDGGRLERFTLRGGRTFNEVNDGDQFCGGGVFARTVSDTAKCGLVYGCVITNCVGQRGGAVRNGRAVNCRILDCGASACAPAGSMSWFLGCYIDGCQYNSQLMRDSYFVGSCTFTANQLPYGGGTAVNEITPGYGGVVNCVFLNKLTALRKNSSDHYRGCKFLATGITDEEQLASLGEGCEEFASAAEFGLDAEGRPLVKTAGTVDAAVDAQAATSASYFAGTDIDGVQRVYNGGMDAGCYEYDWRGEYSKDIGQKVVKADPQVVETADGVLVKDGTLVYEFPENGSGRKCRYTVPFAVTGTGVLSVFDNEAGLGEYTSADGDQTLVFKNAADENRMTFAYASGADDDGGALLGMATTYLPGMMLMLR